MGETSAEERKEEGNRLYKLKKYSEAVKLYTEAIELAPSNPSYYGNRSAAYFMDRSYQASLADARRSTQIDPTFIKGYVREAKCLVCLGHTAAATNIINKSDSFTLTPQEKELIQQLQEQINNLLGCEAQARKASDNGDHRQAAFFFGRCADNAPGCVAYKSLRAESLAMMGKYVEALDVSTDVIRMDPTNVDSIYVRGLCFYYQDEIDKACKMFTEVLRLAPDHVKSREAMKKSKQLRAKKEEGNQAFKAGRFEEAYQLYTAALDIDEYNRITNAKLFCNRAMTGSKLGKLEQSLADCNKALELDQDYTKALHRRAKLYMDLENYEEAVRDYETILKLEPKSENKRTLQAAKLELKKSQRKDYYKILGIDKNANEEEIKKAYRKRALAHHPDRHTGATEEEKKEHEKLFKEIGEAYAVLSDARKKARYDSGQDLDEGMSMSGDIDPNQIFQMFFGGGPGNSGFSFASQGAPGSSFSFRFG